jgi:transcriptional regulator of met regulon
LSEFVDFTYYNEVISAGLQRPPRDVEELRLLTLTDDTARILIDKRTHAAYDEYLHIGCYAFFGSCAYAPIGEGMDAMSNGPPLPSKHAAAVAFIRAGHRTHTATEEAARTQLGVLRLIKGGHASKDADRVFAELAQERFCRPRPTAVSGPLDALRQAFVDRTLELTLHAANKGAACAAFAKVTPDKPPGTDAKARKAAADKRKAAAAAAAIARAPRPTKTGDATRPPRKE